MYFSKYRGLAVRISHGIRGSNVIIPPRDRVRGLNKKAKLTCPTTIRLGIVEDSVIRKNRPRRYLKCMPP